MSEPEDSEARALQRFEALLARCERLRAGGLPFEELRELARLYRRSAAQLARLRDRDDDPEALRYLNALCVRAHAHLATSAPERPGPQPWLRRLPGILARTWPALLLAWLLLAVGITVGAGLVARDPQLAYGLVPSSLGYSASRLDRLIASPDARAAFLAREETPLARNLFFGSLLFAHNTRVGLLAFGTGMLAGIPTVLLAVYNGLGIGALGAIFFRDPWPVAFLAWILPHGIPELSAVTLCVAAGLVLGAAIASPGRHGRVAALREVAPGALGLFLAAVPLFLLAAAIESFVRESALGTGVRLGVAGAMALLVASGTLALWRLDRRQRPDASWLRELTAPPGSDQRPGPVRMAR